MANDWIPLRIDLAEDPAVIAVADALGLDEFAVVGRLHRLWAWANKQLVDGNARGVTAQWVDRFLATPGFADALLGAGWLHNRGDGIEFPNFERWNSQGAKRRLLTARRVKEHKARGNAEGNAAGNAAGNAPGVTSALTKEEKRREEEHSPSESGGVPPPPASPKPKPKPKAAAKFDPLDLPLQFGSPELDRAWARFVGHRARRGKPLTERTAKSLLGKLAAYPEAEAARLLWDAVTDDKDDPLANTCRRGDRAKAGASDPAPKPADPTHQQAVDFFCELWTARYREKYPFDGKDGVAVKYVLDQLGRDLDKFRAVVGRYLADDENFFVKNRHQLVHLRQQLARWLAGPTATRPTVDAVAGQSLPWMEPDAVYEPKSKAGGA